MIGDGVSVMVDTIESKSEKKSADHPEIFTVQFFFGVLLKIRLPSLRPTDSEQQSGVKLTAGSSRVRFHKLGSVSFSFTSSSSCEKMCVLLFPFHCLLVFVAFEAKETGDGTVPKRKECITGETFRPDCFHLCCIRAGAVTCKGGLFMK